MITKTETRIQRQKDKVAKTPNKHISWRERRSTTRTYN